METINRPSAIAVANCLRLGREAEANQQLTAFIDHLAKTITEEVLQNNPRLPTLLAEMLDAQQKRDFLRLADILQYQLINEQQEKRKRYVQ